MPSSDGAHQWWPTHQRIVILTFVDADAAERFDQLTALTGDRESVIRVASSGAAAIDVLQMADIHL